MKKLLILTYYFPPLGLGGTQRVAKFIKYLPQFGWQPTVVTVKPIAYWAKDDSLLQDVREARVIRTESYDPQRLLARLGRLPIDAPSSARRGAGAFIQQKVAPFLMAPDSKILWHPFARQACRDLLRHGNFAALLTTSPPHSVHLIGRVIAKKFKLPWLADFRDGWAGSHVVFEPTKWQSNRNFRQQRLVLRDASAVVAVSPGIVTSLQNSEKAEKCFLIYNGFDPEDFSPSPARGEKYTLCYSGTINRFAQPEPLLGALLRLKRTSPALFHSLRLQFVGLDTLGDFAERVRAHGLQEQVEIVGHREHAEAVAFVQRADALLLIATARPTDTFIPGKTFEYIGARKPIFAISNSVCTNQLLTPYGLARIVDSLQPERICAALTEFLATDWRATRIDHEYINQFNRIAQTEQLAEILNSISRK